MTRSICVIAAHPDDEILGCGGTIAKHKAAGDVLHTLIIAEGATSRSSVRNRETHSTELSQLGTAAKKANALLGVSSTTLLDFPDNRLDGTDLLEVTKAVENFLATYKPAVVYTHFIHDLNIDHQRVGQAVLTACRPLPQSAIDQILMFEICSSTEWAFQGNGQSFAPNYFTDISQTLKEKLAALKCYDSEMRPWPHARSYGAVESLANWRGATIGCDAAEAFVLARAIVR